MQIILIIAVSLHVLAAVAWAGFTFALARTGAAQLERLLPPQLGAATVAVLSGAWLWSLSHDGAFGTAEKALAAGAASALIAMGVQAVTGRAALRAIRGGGEAARRGAAIGQRAAAGLAGLTLILMASARYV